MKRKKRDLLQFVLAGSTPAECAHFPLPKALICLDCDAVFPMPRNVCPACGGHTLGSLARWLDREPSREDAA